MGASQGGEQGMLLLLPGRRESVHTSIVGRGAGGELGSHVTPSSELWASCFKPTSLCDIQVEVQRVPIVAGFPDAALRNTAVSCNQQPGSQPWTPMTQRLWVGNGSGQSMQVPNSRVPSRYKLLLQ